MQDAPSALSAEGAGSPCPKDHPFDPDGNFCCKIAFWRVNGLQTRIPAGWGTDPTIREQRDEIYAHAKRDGRDITLASRAELV